MTEQELKKLSRIDLVEMLLALSRENEQLRTVLARTQKQLDDRTLAVENTGSLAEAALAVNGVLEAAQAAADQYLQNIRQQNEHQQELCARMEQETREKCNRMMMAAKRQADSYLIQVNERLREFNENYFRQVDMTDEPRRSGTQEEK